jgi:hypothetical protein
MTTPWVPRPWRETFLAADTQALEIISALAAMGRGVYMMAFPAEVYHAPVADFIGWIAPIPVFGAIVLMFGLTQWRGAFTRDSVARMIGALGVTASLAAGLAAYLWYQPTNVVVVFYIPLLLAQFWLAIRGASRLAPQRPRRRVTDRGADVPSG